MHLGLMARQMNVVENSDYTFRPKDVALEITVM
jgi:hypothetical protein